MVFAIAGIVVGFIALASIVVISIIGFNKANYIQGDYNTKVKDVVDQVNSAQYYEYEFDKKHKTQTNDLSKNVDDVRNTYLTKDDASSTYVKKSDSGANINTEKLNIANNLIADKNFSQTNNIRFSNKWTGFSDNATDKSEISNDTDTFKKLMIIGNKSAGEEHKVGIWDKLDVHGNLGVDGSATVGGNFSINGTTMYNKGRQNIHGEESLYLLNKSGVVIGKEGGGNGNLNVQGNLGVGANIPSDWRGLNLLRKDGRWSHLDFKDNGINYLRGYTQIDDGLGVSGDAFITGNMSVNSVAQRSDKTLKKNISELSNDEINKLSQLDPKSYQFIDDKNNTKRFGFVAQDVEKVYPNLVSDGQDGKKALNYTDMIPLTVAGINKINKQVQPDKLCINNVCLTEADLLKLKKL